MGRGGAWAVACRAVAGLPWSASRFRPRFRSRVGEGPGGQQERKTPHASRPVTRRSRGAAREAPGTSSGYLVSRGCLDSGREVRSRCGREVPGTSSWTRLPGASPGARHFVLAPRPGLDARPVARCRSPGARHLVLASRPGPVARPVARCQAPGAGTRCQAPRPGTPSWTRREAGREVPGTSSRAPRHEHLVLRGCLDSGRELRSRGAMHFVVALRRRHLVVDPSRGRSGCPVARCSRCLVARCQAPRPGHLVAAPARRVLRLART